MGPGWHIDRNVISLWGLEQEYPGWFTGRIRKRFLKGPPLSIQLYSWAGDGQGRSRMLYTPQGVLSGLGARKAGF